MAMISKPVRFADSRKTTFRGDVLRLLSGTFGSQAIILVATPVLTRLFSPDAFGVVGAFLALVAIPSIISSLRYELAIVLPEDDADAANVFALSLLITTATAFLSCTVLGLWGTTLLQFLRLDEIIPYLWWIPVSIFLSGLLNALTYWNTRTKHFTRQSLSQFTGASLTTGTRVLGGFSGLTGPGTLIFTQIAGQASIIAVLGGRILQKHFRFFIVQIRPIRLVEMLKRYRNFPLFSSWAALVNKTSWQLPILILAVFFSPAVAGFYALGFRVLQMPMHLVGRSISQVFLQRAAEAREVGSLSKLIRSLGIKLTMMGLGLMVPIFLFGPQIFEIAFGAEWREAGQYARILSPWAVAWFVASPLSVIYISLEKQKAEVVISLIIFVTRFLSLLIGGLVGSPSTALLLFSLSGFFVYFGLFFQIYYFVRVEDRKRQDKVSLKKL